MMYGSLDQSISPYKSPIRNPRNLLYTSFPSLSSENYFPVVMGGLHPPPPPPPPYLSRSYPPFSLQSQSSLPPLLPLPTGAAPLRRATSTRGVSSNPKKPYNGRIKQSPSKSVQKSPKKVDKTSPEKVTVSSNDKLGFGPKNSTGDDRRSVDEEFSAFAISSPPPSSLPLPTFSLRPKLSCNVEAAAGRIDTGATDGLRRLLQLP